jgi:hypothetical protein
MPENLVWNGTKLYRSKRHVGEIVQDKTYPSMWRIMRPDGSLSDMLNPTRAKDACAAMATTGERKGRQSRAAAPPASYFPPTLPTQPRAEITALSSAA